MSKVQTGGGSNGARPDFGLEVDQDGGVTVVAVSGEIDIAVAGRLESALARASAKGPRVILDLTECSFIDSSGLRAILLASRELENGRGLAVAAPNSQVLRVLEISRMGDCVPIFDSPRAARGAVLDRTPVD